MHTEETKQLNLKQKEAVLSLWNAEYPKGIQHQDLQELEKYLAGLKDVHHVLLVDNSGVVQAWYADFERGDQRWFAMIVKRENQGKGYGRKLLKLAQERNVRLNGWVVLDASYTKEDGTAYQSPLSFYLKQGFQLIEKERLETEVLKTAKIVWERTDSPFNIRPYQAEDRSILLDVMECLIPQYFDASELQDFKAYLEKEVEDYFVVEQGSRLVGAGGVNYFRSERYARISWDMMHPELQGRGVGMRLLKHRINHIKRQSDMDYAIVRTTQLAYKFYSKGGFQLQHTTKDFWAPGFDLYLMKLEF